MWITTLQTKQLSVYVCVYAHRITEIGDDFTSQASVRNAKIDVSDELIERCATTLSTNEMVVGRVRSAKSNPSSMGTVRRLAVDKNM